LDQAGGSEFAQLLIAWSTEAIAPGAVSGRVRPFDGKTQCRVAIRRDTAPELLVRVMGRGSVGG
jgi:hypothetical protein